MQGDDLYAIIIKTNQRRTNGKQKENKEKVL